MALSQIDRTLLQQCMNRSPGSWESFVDRYLGLVVHVISHSAQSRAINLSTEDSEDLAAEVFMAIIKDDFEILKRFRGESSLATYLTVIARRVVVRELLKRKTAASLTDVAGEGGVPANGQPVEERITNRDEVERLMQQLDGREAEIVRLYHLEGKTYQEISTHTGMAENSVGPLLSRAREKMRQAAT